MTEEEIKFEKALERLEKIVEDLEAGNIPLEDALKKYEEGVRLSGLCQKRLAQAEKKIEMLTRSLDGSLKKVPFEYDEKSGGAEEEEGKASKKGRKSASREASGAADAEELLF